MHTIKILISLVLLTVLARAEQMKLEFILPEQGLATGLEVERKDGRLWIDGVDTGVAMVTKAPKYYRVTENLFAVQVTNNKAGIAFLWDSKKKQVRGKLAGNFFPTFTPVGPRWLFLLKREYVERPGFYGEVTSFYGADPVTENFVEITNAELCGEEDGRFFAIESDFEKPADSTLLIIESGKPPIKKPAHPGDFMPANRDSIRGNHLLLLKRLNAGIKQLNAGLQDTTSPPEQDTTSPPEYEVAVWDFEEEKLKILGQVDGFWSKLDIIPKGGIPESKWPMVRVQWLPGEKEAKPRRQHPDPKTHFVDPKTLKIVK